MLKMKYEKTGILYYGCVIVVAIFVVIMLTSVYPACFPDDSVNILNDIFHHDRWRDWHPVTYYLFCRICMFASNSPYSIILVHGIIAMYIHYRILRYLHLYNVDYACVIYTLALFTIGLTGFEYIIILFKDTPFALGMLGFTISMLYAIREKWSNVSIIKLVIWGVFTSMMRHGGWVAIFGGLLAGAFYYLFIHKRDYAIKLVVAAFCICTIFNSMRAVLIKKYDVSRNPGYVAYTIPLYMLGSYTEHGGDLDDRITSVMEELAPLDVWITEYNKDIYLADNIARGEITDMVDSEGMHFKIIKANAIYFVTEPGEYIRHFFTINSLVWNPITPSDGYIVCMPSLGSGLYISEQFPEWNTRIMGLGKGVRRVFDEIKTTPWKRDIVYRGGINLILILLYLIICIVRKEGEYTIPFYSTIIAIGMIMISIPQQDTRYILPQTMVSCLALSLIVFQKRSIKK